MTTDATTITHTGIINRKLNRIVLGLFAVVFTCLLGCSGSVRSSALVEVKGKVLLEGQPVEHVKVFFDSYGGIDAHAITDKDGAYQLETDDYGPGAAADTYLVRVTRSDSTAPSLVISPIYNEFGVDRVTVSETGSNQFDF